MANKIFISYRREDSGWGAQLVYAEVAKAFGKNSVFFDVAHIPPGENFENRIQSELSQTAILLALMGPAWLGPSPSVNRLREPRDYVRFEIATALSMEIPIIPVVIDDTDLPSEDQLPDDVRLLRKQNFLRITKLEAHKQLPTLIALVALYLRRGRHRWPAAMAALVAYLAACLCAFWIIAPDLKDWTIDFANIFTLRKSVAYTTDHSSIQPQIYLRVSGEPAACQTEATNQIITIRAYEGGVEFDTKTPEREPLKWLTTTCHNQLHSAYRLFDNCIAYQPPLRHSPAYHPKFEHVYAYSTRIGLRSKGTHKFQSDVVGLTCTKLEKETNEGPVDLPDLEEQARLIANERKVNFVLACFILLLATAICTHALRRA